MSASIQSKASQLKGFGGWLLWMSIGVWAGPFISLISLSKVREGVSDELYSRFHLAFDGEMVLIAVLIILQIAVIVFMMKRSWRFVPMFIGMGIYAVLLPLLDIVWSSAVMSALSDVPFDRFADAMVTPEVIGNWIKTIIVIGIWTAYLTRSRRVANTFVRGDTPVATPELA